MSRGLVKLKEFIESYTAIFNMALNRPKDTKVNWGGVDIIEKELKALEIIKEKQVDVKQLIDIDFNYEWYVIETARDKWDRAYILTQEEFDLLKEVLTND